MNLMQYKTLNEERLISISDNDSEFCLLVLKSAFKTIESHINEIIVLLSSDDLIAISRVLHSIKGTSSNIGADRLFQFTLASEKNISPKEISIEDLKFYFKDFKKNSLAFVKSHFKLDSL